MVMAGTEHPESVFAGWASCTRESGSSLCAHCSLACAFRRQPFDESRSRLAGRITVVVDSSSQHHGHEARS